MYFDLSDDDAVHAVRVAIKQAKLDGKTVGLTSGCFDLIHFHHFTFFIRCRRNCDISIVGVDSDELVREVKGASRPVIHDFNRTIMVGALRPVAFVFTMNSVSDFALVAKMLTPDVIFRNEEFKGREGDIAGREHAKRIMILEDQIDCVSTSDIVRRVTKQP